MIPQEAWAAVREIRRLVPKPDELPRHEMHGFGWDFYNSIGCYCPLGLLPYALGDRPHRDGDYQLDADGRSFSLEQAEVFWRWWDAQRDPKKAVAEVWDDELVNAEELVT